MTTNTQIATAQPERKSLAQSISLMRPQIGESLPPGVDPDRFIRVAMNAVQNQPELNNPDIDRQTVFNACLRAAQLGLMPDKREGAIVVVNEKRKVDGRDVWVKVAQFRDMVGGLRKLAADFGFDLIARAVYENDAFEYSYGDEDRVSHVPPKLGQPRGALIGAYAIATRFVDGRKWRLVMDMEAINKRRAVAQTQAVWDKWTSEQSEKTVARALFKQLPLSDEDAQKAERLARLVTGEDEVEQTARDAERAEAASQAAPVAAKSTRTRPSVLDKVAPVETAPGPSDAVDADFADVTDERPVTAEGAPAAGEPATHF